MDYEKLVERIKKKFSQSYLYQTREQSMQYQSWSGGMLDWSLTEHLESLRDEIIDFSETEYRQTIEKHKIL